MRKNEFVILVGPLAELPGWQLDMLIAGFSEVKIRVVNVGTTHGFVIVHLVRVEENFPVSRVRREEHQGWKTPRLKGRVEIAKETKAEQTFRKEGSKVTDSGVLETGRRKSFHKDRNLF